MAQEGKIDEALAQFEKAVELNPDNGRAHCNLGARCRRRDGPKKRWSICAKAFRSSPNLPTARTTWGPRWPAPARWMKPSNTSRKQWKWRRQSVEYRYNFGAFWPPKGGSRMPPRNSSRRRV
jgi:tetratricopeptide (TPR) repeat protein